MFVFKQLHLKVRILLWDIFDQKLISKIHITIKKNFNLLHKNVLFKQNILCHVNINVNKAKMQKWEKKKKVGGGGAGFDMIKWSKQKK